MTEAQTMCPRDGLRLVAVGEEGRFLECVCGFKFDLHLSREVVSEADKKRARETQEVGAPVAWTIAGQLLEDDRFATLNGSEEVLVYRDGVYTEGGEAHIKKLVQQNVERTKVTGHLVREVVGHVQRSTYVKREDFLSEGPLLVVENGLLDTDVGELKPHTPDFYTLSKLPVKFVPGQDCPAFRKFLSEVLYAEDLPVVQEWLGYCLHRGYPAQVAMLFVGEGNNGKSTLIDTMKALLGRDNISAVSLQELEINRFAKADLFGKLANLYADLPDSALRCVGTFKMLTGGDPIRGEKKFQNSFTFDNHAKLTFSCNVVPEVYEDTTAFFRRWIIVQFPHAFEGERADREIRKKLTTLEELSGILNFALEGLARLRSKGWTFSNSKSTEDVRQDYIRRSSPTKAFLMDCTFLKADGVVAKKALFEAYVNYCQKTKLAAVTMTTFFRNLPLYFAGHPLEESREGRGKQVYCFRGIKLRPEKDWGKPAPEEEPEGMKEVDN